MERLIRLAVVAAIIAGGQNAWAAAKVKDLKIVGVGNRLTRGIIKTMQGRMAYRVDYADGTNTFSTDSVTPCTKRYPDGRFAPQYCLGWDAASNQPFEDPTLKQYKITALMTPSSKGSCADLTKAGKSCFRLRTEIDEITNTNSGQNIVALSPETDIPGPDWVSTDERRGTTSYRSMKYVGLAAREKEVGEIPEVNLSYVDLLLDGEIITSYPTMRATAPGMGTATATRQEFPFSICLMGECSNTVSLVIDSVVYEPPQDL